MAKDTKNEPRAEAEATVGHGGLEMAIRQRARMLIDAIVEEELEHALGAAPSVRVGAARAGYRHGTRDRTLTTSLGPTTFAMPRARVVTPEGGTTEWRSELVPRYQRRSEQVDEAILGVYLSGTNTRRIKGALAPLLRGGPLSKDAVSRLVGDESTAAWRDVIHTLVARHVGIPRLAVIDGNPGLAAALREQWPTLAIQRCTTHKLRNVEAKAPARLREELAEDYRRMIYAETRTMVEQARARFLKKWRLRCPAVIECLDEAGDDLFTFLRFPKLQWKALRTTNALERINEEFRRRTKTQASLPSQDAVLLLLFGLLRSGQVKMRKIDGWHEMERAQQAA